ncbi:hypothetical protein M9H77_02297 [Catharanthus roseus]|uniref:Uncharacterized protein n=1 Tax=Catharanthus roseus TaxID=4058 RepID=A0ACC0C856_CATRO|nr:hypothetical protein M9H77_02297 [Catharanthus roseus]
MHLGPIVPDVLSRQHEHRSGLIWSGDHETCYTDLQCKHFGRNLFQCYSTAPTIKYSKYTGQKYNNFARTYYGSNTMVFDEPSMLYSIVNNDDDEVDGSDGDDAISSQSESDEDNDPEEGEFQTPLNPVNPVNPISENIVQQWESSQWFSNARYDYTHSGAFLDIGSGSPIDDLVEFGTVRLFDWNDSMTDI